jgi:putative RNA 2'-phosphotransferase
MADRYTRLSKLLALALRHHPRQLGLELDAEGWVPVAQLLTALHRQRDWRDVSEDDLHELIRSATKQRHEIRDGRIRALYGHTLPGKLAREPVIPPPVLYHGTARRLLQHILSEGLRPMSRQYVHLSRSTEMARQVGKRRDAEPIILEIDTKAAAEAGVTFYRGNDEVYLADHVPAMYLRVWTEAVRNTL